MSFMRASLTTVHKGRDFLSAHKYALVLLYLPCYLLYFGVLELFPAKEFVLIHSPVDDWIPQIPAFCIAYALWWGMFPGMLLWFLLREGKWNFLGLCFTLFLGYTICLISYTIAPNGIALRRPLDPRDIFTPFLALLRSIDKPQNVCPSMHVSSTAAILLFLPRAEKLSGAVKGILLLLGVLIILSTMLIKQHSVIDVSLGIVMSALLFTVWNLLDFENIKH